MKPLPSHSPIRHASEQDIASLEQWLEVRLPEQYKELLRTNNGVELEKEIDLPDFKGFCMNRFYNAVAVDTSLPEVVQVNGDYDTRLPGECITIGCDVYGNEVLLVISGEDRGRILFWDHEQEGFDEPEDPYHNVYELAPDLETLVNALADGKPE